MDHGTTRRKQKKHKNIRKHNKEDIRYEQLLLFTEKLFFWRRTNMEESAIRQRTGKAQAAAEKVTAQAAVAEADLHAACDSILLVDNDIENSSMIISTILGNFG